MNTNKIDNLTFMNKPVVLIEFSGDCIKRVWNSESEYSIYFSKKQKIFLSTEDDDKVPYFDYFSNMEDVSNDKNLVRLEKMPLCNSDLQEIFDNTTFCDFVAYCHVCDDYYEYHSECKHLQWSDNDGMFVGCGSEEIENENLPEYYTPGIFKIFDYLGVNNVLLFRQYLFKQDYYINVSGDEISYIMSDIPYIYGYINFSGLKDYDNDVYSAVLWLKSLEKKVTKSAEDQTIAWINTWLRNWISTAF